MFFKRFLSLYQEGMSSLDLEKLEMKRKKVFFVSFCQLKKTILPILGT